MKSFYLAGLRRRRYQSLPLALCLLGLIGSHTVGQVLMDGSLNGDNYGSALSIQNTNTQFGDGQIGDTVEGGGGSEIDGFYAQIQNGRLYMMVTGNLETNFNKLEFFFDTRPAAKTPSMVRRCQRGSMSFRPLVPVSSMVAHCSA